MWMPDGRLDELELRGYLNERRCAPTNVQRREWCERSGHASRLVVEQLVLAAEPSKDAVVRLLRLTVTELRIGIVIPTVSFLVYR